jgi:hypothetical protein
MAPRRIVAFVKEIHALHEGMAVLLAVASVRVRTADVNRALDVIRVQARN